MKKHFFMVSSLLALIVCSAHSMEIGQFISFVSWMAAHGEPVSQGTHLPDMKVKEFPPVQNLKVRKNQQPHVKAKRQFSQHHK